MKSLEEIKPGLTLGRYECLLPIARGGMAAVWAARVTGARGFEKTVAIKTMLPSLNDDPNFERMFLDEARIASRIRHPNVAEILDLGEQDNLLYLVMEWVDGAPLSLVMRESFRRGGMPIPIGVKIIQDTCAALHAAHELKGDDGRSLELVHRDVSPQNIMLTEGGIVKLVDFGVAKALGRSAGETDTGLIRGKLAYLAPEQVVAQPLDRRTDLFAAGVILYQITTGKHPFRADNAGATMNNILRRKVPKPSKIVGPMYPPALDEIVMRALDREQEFRFQTAADMVKALDAVFVGKDRATTEDVAAYVKPLIGPSGEEFRRALRQASRTPSNSGEDVASLLASGAHPVDGTPASGNWIMGSSSVRDIERYGISSGDTDGLQAPPASFESEPSSGEPLPGSPPSPVGAQAPVEVARGSLAETTMSGAERDTQPPARPPSKRRNIGLAVLAIVLTGAVGVLVVARFVSSPEAKHEPHPVTSVPVVTSDTTTEPVAVQQPEASTDSADSQADAGVEARADAAESPPGDTTAPATTRTSKPPAAKSSSKDPGKKWTPPVSDPGF